MFHVLNIITGITWFVLVCICGYFVGRAKHSEDIEDEYNYSIKADICLACMVIILVVRAVFWYIYK